MDSSLNLSYRILSVAFVNLTHESTVHNKIFGILITIIIMLQLNQQLYVFLENHSIIAILRLTLQNSVFNVGILKIMSFIIWKDKWLKVFKFVVKTERYQRDGKEIICYIVDQYTKHGRNVVLFIWTIAITTLVGVYGRAWYDFFCGIEVSQFQMYWPKYNDGKYYCYLNIFLQHIYGHMIALYGMSWNTTFLLLMSFFSGQLKVVRNRLRHALDCEDEIRQRRDLIDILRHYRNLRKYSKLCDSLTSPVLFVHLLLISANLAVFLREAATHLKGSEIIASLFYINAILNELSLAYWHGNEVTYQSNLVSYGIYESKWSDKSIAIQKLIQHIIVATSFSFKFSAGAFNTVSLKLMVLILRISYSFFTLSAQIN